MYYKLISFIITIILKYHRNVLEAHQLLTEIHNEYKHNQCNIMTSPLAHQYGIQINHNSFTFKAQYCSSLFINSLY